MSRSSRKPYYYICNNNKCSYSKKIHNRRLRRLRKKVLYEASILKDFDNEKIPSSLGIRKTEGLDIYLFPSDGGSLYGGNYKYSDDKDLKDLYKRISRK